MTMVMASDHAGVMLALGVVSKTWESARIIPDIFVARQIEWKMGGGAFTLWTCIGTVNHNP